MSVLALSLALLGATVEYRAEFRTVPSELPEEMRALVESTLAGRGHVLVAESAAGRVNASSAERLELEVVGAVTIARVIVRRVRTDATESSPVVLQLEGDLPWPTWRAALRALLEELYPVPEARTNRVEFEAPKTSDSPRLADDAAPRIVRPTWPLWISGAGAVAVAVGIGFGLKSQLAVQEVEDGERFNPEGAMVLRRSSDEATIANVFLVSGGLVVASGLLLYLLGGP